MREAERSSVGAVRRVCLGVHRCWGVGCRSRGRNGMSQGEEEVVVWLEEGEEE